MQFSSGHFIADMFSLILVLMYLLKQSLQNVWEQFLFMNMCDVGDVSMHILQNDCSVFTFMVLDDDDEHCSFLIAVVVVEDDAMFVFMQGIDEEVRTS